MGWGPVFPKSYEAVPVPLPIYLVRETDEEMGGAKERFFDEVKGSLRIGPLAVNLLCKVYGQHVLWLDDIQPLASVRTLRNPEDGSITRFMKYPLLPRTIQVIHEINMIDEIMPGR